MSNTPDPDVLTDEERGLLFEPSAHVDPLMELWTDERMTDLQAAMDSLTDDQREVLTSIVVNIANDRGQRALDAVREEIRENMKELPDPSDLKNIDDAEDSAFDIRHEFDDATEEAFGLRTEILGCW